MIGNVFRIVIILMAIISLQACDDNYTPKPKAYPKIVFPEKKYTLFDSVGFPFRFEYPVYAKPDFDISFFNEAPENPFWMTLYIPSLNARIHLSYKEIKGANTFDKLLKDAFTMSFKHSIKAESIDEEYIHPRNKVAGLMYHIGGNAASSEQFFLTDSTHHFLRGSLYFYCPSNADSLAPAIHFLKTDINHLVNTFEWKK